MDFWSAVPVGLSIRSTRKGRLPMASPKARFPYCTRPSQPRNKATKLGIQRWQILGVLQNVARIPLTCLNVEEGDGFASLRWLTIDQGVEIGVELSAESIDG